MALDFTELDAYVAAATGAPLEDDVFTEIKSNLQKAANPDEIITDSDLSGTFAGSGNSATVQVTNTIADTSITGAFALVAINDSELTEEEAASIGAFWAKYDSTTDNENGTFTHDFLVYNTGDSGATFSIVPVFMGV